MIKATLEQINAVPERDIFHSTIQKLRTNEWYACVAFSIAVEDKYGEYYTDELMYREQLAQFAESLYPGKPQWWNKNKREISEPAEVKADKIRIVKEFYKACFGEEYTENEEYNTCN